MEEVSGMVVVVCSFWIEKPDNIMAVIVHSKDTDIYFLMDSRLVNTPLYIIPHGPLKISRSTSIPTLTTQHEIQKNSTLGVNALCNAIWWCNVFSIDGYDIRSCKPPRVTWSNAPQDSSVDLRAKDCFGA